MEPPLPSKTSGYASSIGVYDCGFPIKSTQVRIVWVTNFWFPLYEICFPSERGLGISGFFPGVTQEHEGAGSVQDLILLLMCLAQVKEIRSTDDSKICFCNLSFGKRFLRHFAKNKLFGQCRTSNAVKHLRQSPSAKTDNELKTISTKTGLDYFY